MGLLDGTVAWLVDPETIGSPVELFAALAERMLAAGIAVERASASLMTKHPDVFGTQLVWVKGQGAKGIPRSHAVMASAMYRDSPVAYVRRERKMLRARLESAEELEYDLLRELQGAGITDYVIFPMPYRSGLNSFISWATSRAGGFTDEEMVVFQGIIPALSLRWELESSTYALDTLLSTYLGENAARRVLDGEFKRRTGAVMRAVIWTADLRGFTAMVDEQSIDQVLATLDEYFSCVAEPIAEHGGDLLKFIGDAVLAVFPVDDDNPAAACANALAALDRALAVQRRVNDERRERGAAPVRFGLALHVGDLVFGNIGVRGRLDFTVVGRAVNEVCRVEAMTKQLAIPVLFTGDFVDAAGVDAAFLGTHDVRGVSTRMRLYTLGELQ